MKTLLIVEDHDDSRFVLRTILDHAGYRVVEAENGKDGVTLAIREAPDLVLMDIRMPGMNGFEASEAIRAQPGRGDVPIIAVTAEVFDAESRDRAAGLFDTLLTKPVRPQELKDHVRRTIGDP